MGLTWTKPGVSFRSTRHVANIKEFKHRIAQIECVIVNWKRPHNLPTIINMLRKHNMYITLIELPDSKQSQATLADRVITLDNNYGCINRYLSWHLYNGDSTLFIDDDILPGDDLLDNLKQPGDYGVIGCDGRQVIWRDNKITDYKKSITHAHWVARFYYVRNSVLEILYNAWLELGRFRYVDDILLSFAAHLCDLKTILLHHKLVGLDESCAAWGMHNFKPQRINFINSIIKKYPTAYGYYSNPSC